MNAVNELVKRTSTLVAKNAPAILAAIGAVGVVSTAVLAVKATPQAMEAVYELKSEYPGPIEDEEFVMAPVAKLEIIKATWKIYLPAVISGVGAITCIIGATTIGQRRSAALLSAYTIADKALGEYRTKVIETLGDKKAATIQEAIVQDHINANPKSRNLVFRTNGGDTLCYDEFSGRYFLSDMESLRRSENDLNHRLLNDEWVNVNTLYDLIGLPQIKFGELMGWYPDNLVQFKYPTMLADDNTPCMVLGFEVDPRGASYYR